MRVKFWWGTRSLGRSRLRFEDNIKMDLQEVEWRGTWITLISFRIGTGGERLCVCVCVCAIL
jgi:hypothetical protein